PRTLLRDDVHRRIRDAIVRGELQPGEKLRDGELGDWLGVSRTPVREALLKLAEAGLVTARPGRETIVAPEDPVALAHARTLAATPAAPHAAADPAAVPRLREAHERLRTATDPEAAISADTQFHDVVVTRSGNPLLPGQLDTLVPILLRAEFLHFDAQTAAA